jgi:hypothetical protein
MKILLTLLMLLSPLAYSADTPNGAVSEFTANEELILYTPTVPTLSPTAVSPTPTAVSMPSPAIVSIVASGSKYPAPTSVIGRSARAASMGYEAGEFTPLLPPVR